VGDGDAHFTGDGVEQIEFSVFLKNEGIAKLWDVDGASFFGRSRGKAVPS